MQHTHSKFDADMQSLRSLVVTMGQSVEKQFLRSVESIRTSDLRLASEVLEEEQQVNHMHLQIDLLCNQIIAKRQPIAVDLREILSILHINNDLERIGDEAKKIAYRARDLHNDPLPIDVGSIGHMAELVGVMVNTSVRAFVTLDPGSATALHERDDEVDALRDRLVSELVGAMGRLPNDVGTALALVFVVQSIERVGDHAKNIAEYIFNAVEGVDTRHRARG